MIQKIKKAARIIRESSYTVAFTGAGVSVESGIPPFRGENGLWSKYDPKVLDLDYFYSHPIDSWEKIKEIFYDFFGKAEPNDAHKVLAGMEEKGLLKSIITQNIDHLHQKAGSKIVWEFHGNSQQLICPNCQTQFPVPEVDLTILPPHCPNDHTILKPDFVFFGEGIPEKAFEMSFKEASRCEVMLLIGTTGEVVPASMVPYEAKKGGATIIEINPEISVYTKTITDIFIPGKAGEIMNQLAGLIF